MKQPLHLYFTRVLCLLAVSTVGCVEPADDPFAALEPHETDAERLDAFTTNCPSLVARYLLATPPKSVISPVRSTLKSLNDESVPAEPGKPVHVATAFVSSC